MRAARILWRLLRLLRLYLAQVTRIPPVVKGIFPECPCVWEALPSEGLKAAMGTRGVQRYFGTSASEQALCSGRKSSLSIIGALACACWTCGNGRAGRLLLRSFKVRAAEFEQFSSLLRSRSLFLFVLFRTSLIECLLCSISTFHRRCSFIWTSPPSPFFFRPRPICTSQSSGSGTVITAKAFKIATFQGLSAVATLFNVNFGTNIAADTCVALCLSYFLWVNRTGIQRCVL